MDYKAIRKAVKTEKRLQRVKRNIASSTNMSHTDNTPNIISDISNGYDEELLTEKQKYIADKIIESKYYSGQPFFEEDYYHLCRNLLSNSMIIDDMEVVVVKHRFGFDFSFIENS
jgi:hypothetical protein